MKERLAPLSGKIENKLFSCDVVVAIQQAEHMEDCVILFSFYNFKSDDDDLCDMLLDDFDNEFVISSGWLNEVKLVDKFKDALLKYSLSGEFEFLTTTECNSESIHYSKNKKEFSVTINLFSKDI